MLEKLSSGQWESVSTYRDQMLSAGRVCGPVDRLAAEQAIMDVYAERGLSGPSKVIWARSPQEGCIFASALQSTGDQLREQLREQLYDQLRDQLSDQLNGQLGSHFGSQLYIQLEGQLKWQLWEQLGSQLGNQISEKTIEQLNKACFGPHDLDWLGVSQFLKLELGLSSTADPGPQIGLAKNCGWWWPFEGAVVLTEHPVSLSLDAEGRLHSETGMAIKYSDGFGLYSWHGVQVEPSWILSPSSVTPTTALTWPNIEQRRVAAEIVGWDRVLSELGAKKIDVDIDPQIGVLLEVSLPDSGLERFLRVECGTGRTFALPVPPSVQTALEAQCWIHGGISPSIIRQLEVRT